MPLSADASYTGLGMGGSVTSGVSVNLARPWNGFFFSEV